MHTPNSRRGLVDYLEPEFLHALGISVATFALVETLLKNAYFHAMHGHFDFAKEAQTVMEIHECKFSARIDKLFSVLRSKVSDFEGRGFGMLQEDFHKTRVVRNFVVHGTWKKTAQKGLYKLSHIDDQGRVINEPISKDMLVQTAVQAENLMVELKSLLVSEGLFPPVGPKIFRQ